MGRLSGWLEERLGISTFAKFGSDYLDKPVPKHVNYAFTLGTAALTLFATQVASGVLLAFNYSSSMKDAYDSVHRITHELPAGWLLRSFHAWGAHLMVLVLLVHMLRVFWYGGYKAPREGTWLFGTGLLLLTLLFGFTGYLLPMDQVAYWATKVGTDPVDNIPVIGDALLRMMRGSESVGDATISRFFIIHVFLLPAGLAALAGAHLFLVARHGISPRESVSEERERGYKNIVAAEGVRFSHHLYRELTTVIVVLSLVVTFAVLFPAELGERATPLASTPKGIKPEWYFLPVYQLLKFFPELVGLLVVNAALAAFVMLPFIDRSPERAPGKRKKMMVVAAAALLATLVLGTLGFLSDSRRFGVTFDKYGLPAAEEEAPKK
jgi:quinol-cytochrome oxidoreductase complex cytochrome b subunit